MFDLIPNYGYFPVLQQHVHTYLYINNANNKCLPKSLYNPLKILHLRLMFYLMTMTYNLDGFILLFEVLKNRSYLK